MSNITPLRKTIGSYLGQVLTPEIAAEIESASSTTVAETLERLPIKPTIEQIKRIERYILQVPQVETPTTHYFSPGIYAREMFIPAGTLLTGAVHKVEHLALFVGDITVWTEEGMKRLTGHHTFISKPGAKRVGFAHADTWCTGFFATDKTDVRALEEELVEDAHLLQCNLPQLPTQTQEQLKE